MSKRAKMDKKGKPHSKSVNNKRVVATKKMVPVKVARSREEAASARKALRIKAQEKVIRDQAKQAIVQMEIERVKVDGLLENELFAEFVSRNVGKKAINIIKLLNTPQTDEKLAADLAVKINEVRRILNVLDSYGVARYDTNKDSKGWLTFKWYLDTEKLGELHKSVIEAKPENAYDLPENCNDFFYCSKCYSEQKVILPFDAAFEAQFKCDNCGKALRQLNKSEAKTLFEENVAESKSVAPA